MPTLNWLGKDKVIGYHREVMPHALECRWTHGTLPQDVGAKPSMVIHGDNLLALKALLPEYEGKVDVVYIDPPYNTGSEGWVYNDNVNDPRMRRWLGKVVGKEGEDFSRHDKWLCMMYPRLQLLRELMAPAASLFVSIDDNELANLRLVMDEIFGASCFVADVSWQRTYSTRNDSKGIVTEVEHLLVYGKQPGWQPKRLPRSERSNSYYKNPDKDRCAWRSSDAFAPGAATHQGMVYAVQHPFTGELIYPYSSACWRYEQPTMLEIMSGWCPYELRNLHDEERRAQVCGIPTESVRADVPAIMLAQPLDVSRRMAERVLKKGPWPRFFFSRGGKGGIARKTYLDSVGGPPPTNYWPYAEVGHTDGAKKQLLSIFGEATFDTPKPVELVERILAIAAGKDSLVLDSFAGSGTTGHAVLKANADDSGTRRFILVELGDYAESVTAERLRRVCDGYTDRRSKTGAHVPGAGGFFSYWELGEALLDEDGGLNMRAGREALRRYVWFSQTRTPLPQINNGHPYHLGQADGTDYYLCLEPDHTTTLDFSLVASLPAIERPTVIFADRCIIPHDMLDAANVVFKKLSGNLMR